MHSVWSQLHAKQASSSRSLSLRAPATSFFTPDSLIFQDCINYLLGSSFPPFLSKQGNWALLVGIPIILQPCCPIPALFLPTSPQKMLQAFLSGTLVLSHLSQVRCQQIRPHFKASSWGISPAIFSHLLPQNSPFSKIYWFFLLDIFISRHLQFLYYSPPVSSPYHFSQGAIFTSLNPARKCHRSNLCLEKSIILSKISGLYITTCLC